MIDKLSETILEGVLDDRFRYDRLLLFVTGTSLFLKEHDTEKASPYPTTIYGDNLF